MRLARVLGWTALAVPLGLVVTVFVAWAMSDNVCEFGRTDLRNPVAAIAYCEYGTVDRLQLVQVEKPVPADDELLVRVRAASVNPLDWHYLRGTPYVMRLDSGLRKPEVTRLGVDFAGTVEAVGRNVTRFQPGDAVFGGRTGAFAEYVTVRESGAVTLKPPGIGFEEAAAVPIAALTALQALRDAGGVQREDTVLVNGASGGVGTFAVQLATHFGAHVTGICSTRNQQLVRSLGAELVVDYTKEDFTERAERYDLILDLVGNRDLSDLRRAMNPDGKAILVGGGGPDAGNWIGPLARPLTAVLYNPFVEEEFVPFLAQLTAQDLAFVGGLMESGAVHAVIDRRYGLAEVPEAIRYLEEGHARGKVIIVIE
ncbi:MAG TPA: NAD(P)-dependent alcohol dehydrogenase [Woeseiaceae bacterium]